MFADIKNSRRRSILQVDVEEEETAVAGTTKMNSGRVRRALKRLLKVLGHRSSKDKTTSLPNNIKDCTNNVNEDYVTDFVIQSADLPYRISYYEVDPFHTDFVECQDTADFAGLENVYYCEEHEEKGIIVPVHYARTDAGTFFWTSVQDRYDDDLIQPLYCETGNQMAQVQWR